MTAFPLGSPCTPRTRQELYQSLLSTTHLAVPVMFSSWGMVSAASEPCLGSPGYKGLVCCLSAIGPCAPSTRFLPGTRRCAKLHIQTPRSGDLTELGGSGAISDWGLAWVCCLTMAGLGTEDSRITSQPLSVQEEVSPWAPGTNVHITSELRSPFWSIWRQPSCQVRSTEVASPGFKSCLCLIVEHGRGQFFKALVFSLVKQGQRFYLPHGIVMGTEMIHVPKTHSVTLSCICLS